MQISTYRTLYRLNSTQNRVLLSGILTYPFWSGLMRVWLAAFVILFAAVELFQWVLRLPSLQPSGFWLVVGGMGLATMSNFGRLVDTGEKAAKGSGEDEKKRGKGEQLAQATTSTVASTVSSTAPAKPDEPDTISFKVRPMKR